MASFFEISTKEVIDEYFLAKTIAEERRDLETTNAIKIQAAYKQFSTRKAFWIMKLACTDIQRIFRGHMHGRVVTRKLAREAEQRERDLFYNFCATQIQKIYRGFINRKYGHDYYRRKYYLQNITQKGEETKLQIDETIKNQSEEAEREREQKEKDDFDNACNGLHHLVSTKTIAGVYKKPQNIYSDSTIYGTPIEDHLRANTRVEFAKSMSTRGTVRKMSPTQTLDSSYYLQYPTAKPKEELKLPPIDPRDKMKNNENKRLGPFKSVKALHETKNKTYDRSVQSQVPYGSYIETIRHENKIEKLTRIKGDFVVRKNDTPPHPHTIRVSEEYQAPLPNVGRGPTRTDKIPTPFLPTKSNNNTDVFDSENIPYIGTTKIHNVSSYRERI